MLALLKHIGGWTGLYLGSEHVLPWQRCYFKALAQVELAWVLLSQMGITPASYCMDEPYSQIICHLSYAWSLPGLFCTGLELLSHFLQNQLLKFCLCSLQHTFAFSDVLLAVH